MENLTQQNRESNPDILIVEDSPTQAAQLEYVLERHGVTVSIAANGKEALAVMAGERPAMVISDIIMPEMDGFELCRRIKANKETRNIPVILLTALSDPQDVIMGLACGADNFITKPYDEAYLLARIGHMQANRHLHLNKDNHVEIEILYAGQKYTIKSDCRQILDFLLSTYETAIQKNRESIRAQDELNASNEQLAAAVKELETFSYTVSHDLRSPLTNIHGCSQVLLDMCKDRLDEESLGFIGTIYKEAQRMNQLISTLIDFSRLIGGELKRTMVDLSQMTNVIAAGLRQNHPERRVTFRIADGVTVNGDAKLLRVVMENLLGNAWKYSGKKETAVIEFGSMEHDGRRSCFVRDNGAGFEMSMADKLFVPFKRLHDQLEFPGAGIGLATVQRIIRRHGGRVWAEGDPGKGATFYFTL